MRLRVVVQLPRRRETLLMLLDTFTHDCGLLNQSEMCRREDDCENWRVVEFDGVRQDEAIRRFADAKSYQR